MMIRDRRLILHRFSDVPLALAPRVIPSLFEAGARQLMQLQRGDIEDGDEGNTLGARTRGYYVTGNIGVIEIRGILTDDDSDVGWFDESANYQDIGNAYDEIMHDNGIAACVLQVSSPGGLVSGLFDLVDSMHAQRGRKPVVALVDDFAASAAYAIASVADQITVSRTAIVGSIGVVTAHFDISALLEKYGVKVSLVQFGERKSDLTPFKPLSDSARRSLQSDVDTIGEEFVSTVARNRNVDRASIRNQEAATFLGAKGVEAGLADAVMSPQVAFANLVAEINPRRLTGP